MLTDHRGHALLAAACAREVPMRFTRTISDVTVGTLIVMVHAALRRINEGGAIEVYELRGRPRDPRRGTSRRRAIDRRAYDHLR
jgi:hypothetical protein